MKGDTRSLDSGSYDTFPYSLLAPVGYMKRLVLRRFCIRGAGWLIIGSSRMLCSNRPRREIGNSGWFRDYGLEVLREIGLKNHTRLPPKPEPYVIDSRRLDPKTQTPEPL